MKVPKAIFLLVFSIILIVGPPAFGQDGMLYVFTQSTDSDFTKKSIDSLQRYTKAQNIPIKIVQLSKEVPKDLPFTPFIVYENQYGRSPYKGRFTSYSRIRNFVRSLARRAKPFETKTIENQYLWESGPTKVVFHLESTAPTGPGLKFIKDSIRFKKAAEKGIEKGLTALKKWEKATVSAATYNFYFNFHPYVGANKKLYVSTSIYSGYDCVTPVFTQYELPARASVRRVEKVFAQAAADLQQTWLNLIQHSEIGDALNPIAADLEQRSWEEMGFVLPRSSEKANTQNLDLSKIELPLDWIYAGSPDDQVPAVAFSFPAPLTQYSGEASDVKGHLRLKKNGTLNQATGRFQVNTHSVTMGLEDLDHHIHEQMLFVDSLPEASFEILDFKSNKTLSWDQLIPIEVKAKFTLKNISLMLEAKGQAELVLDEDGKTPALLVEAGFHLPELEQTFGLEKPGGDEKANNQLFFNLYFLLKAVLEK